MNYSNRSNGRNGARYQEPNLSIVSKAPDLPEMRGQLKAAVDDLWEFYDRCEHALNVRYCSPTGS